MSFMTSYKKLEQICRDITGADRPVSAYIDAMRETTQGARYVPGWEEDLKQLKHYRWVRNQIVHETGKTEENMCTSLDVVWIDNFYNRILNQTDPLALYHQAMRRRLGKNGTRQEKPVDLKVNDWYDREDKDSDRTKALFMYSIGIIFLLCILTAVAVALS